MDLIDLKQIAVSNLFMKLGFEKTRRRIKGKLTYGYLRKINCSSVKSNGITPINLRATRG